MSASGFRTVFITLVCIMIGFFVLPVIGAPVGLCVGLLIAFLTDKQMNK